ncbi:hypothetical protein [Streptodolium elevatio]|uniref:Uncharacterized protein n=1 Tax=Streptodolium elevatio TaxID=3157996 RepID=A0ABV3DZD8_9ACTN
MSIEAPVDHGVWVATAAFGRCSPGVLARAANRARRRVAEAVSEASRQQQGAYFGGTDPVSKKAAVTSLDGRPHDRRHNRPDTGTAAVSQNEMCELLGASKPTVNRGFKDLRECGLA